LASKITKLTKSEADRLQSQGILTINQPQVTPMPALQPDNPVSDADMAAAHEMIEAAKGIATMASENTARQSQLIESLVREMADKMNAQQPGEKSWKKLRVHFERDRNNMLRSAEFEKID
jgi:thiamine pyrophosphate-dependent acetolactate synthase large subunit-like protein